MSYPTVAILVVSSVGLFAMAHQRKFPKGFPRALADVVAVLIAIIAMGMFITLYRNG